MEKFSVPREIGDFMRTAPYGEVLLIANSLATALNVGMSGEFGVLGALGSIGVLCSFVTVVNQFVLRRRLENSIREYGYSDSAFEGTTKQWCSRQTARVVTDRYGCTGQYENLCARNRGKMEFEFVPNF